MSGIVALRGVTVSAKARNASCAGAMSGEWNACETGSGVILAPSRASAVVMRLTASAGPDTTVEAGPLIAAIPQVGSSATRFATCSAGTSTALIAPPIGSCCITAPRATTRPAASSSVKTSASAAAANSPTLWPIRNVGSTPRSSSAAPMAYDTANSAG